MKNAAQGHTTVEEEDKTIIMKNLHLLPKKRAQKGSDGRDPDYIPEQKEVW
jgi:hypothetical protein